VSLFAGFTVQPFWPSKASMARAAAATVPNFTKP